MKKVYNVNRTDNFDVGGFMYLASTYCQVSLSLLQNLKKFPRFNVVCDYSEGGVVAHKFKLPDDARVHPIFHISCLKKKISSNVLAQTCCNSGKT